MKPDRKRYSFESRLSLTPIVALAPMIVVILNQFDITGIIPKAVIAAYLSFFPVTVGMVKGLRSPDPLQLDLMRTYCATRAQTFLHSAREKWSAKCSNPPASGRTGLVSPRSSEVLRARRRLAGRQGSAGPTPLKTNCWARLPESTSAV